jgi:outer membrane protein TolC
LVCVIGSIAVSAEELSFQHAIQLALTHNPAVAIAVADQLKAEKAYAEVRNAYKPNLVFGSGLGWSYGFPMSIEGSAPSIFQVNYQSALYNPALSQFSKSAKLEWSAATKSADDQRKDVILDTALTYIQLDNTTAELRALKGQEEEANNLAGIVGERVKQGVDSQIELTKARLMAARVHLRIAELEGSADVLREKLAKNTGLTAASIETDTESIPKFPEVDQQSDLASKALEQSNAVRAAMDRADAQQFKAKGEWRSLYPSFDIVGTYGLFSKFNNYEDFFRKFQRNNATVGVSIKFPIFNYAQRARAAQAEADAIKARKQVEAVKNQVSEDTLRLQRSVRQLAAAKEVAQLEYELAQSEAESTRIRAESGAPALQVTGGPPQGGTVTARDVANARLQAGDRYSQFVSTTFEYDKAQLQLLRLTGELESWAGTGK